MLSKKKIPIVSFVEKSDTPPPVEMTIHQGYRPSICDLLILSRKKHKSQIANPTNPSVRDIVHEVFYDVIKDFAPKVNDNLVLIPMWFYHM